jgi:NTE family protein
MGRTAFVLSGGSSLGAVQAGMTLALEQADIRPDLIVGTSAGALNGSWLASGRDASGLIELWHGLERRSLFPLHPLLGLRAFLGRIDHFVPNTGLRRLLDRQLGFSRMEDAPVDFAVLATDILSGDEAVLQTGSAIEAVLASSALPGIFPPVRIDGRLLFDGGIANNTPISTAIDLGADEVWVLSTGYSCGLRTPPDSALALALHGVGLLVQQRLVRETQRTYDVPVHLIPPPCPVDVSPADFSQTHELIAMAHAGTQQWLANGRPTAQPLVVPHIHAGGSAQ